MSKAKDVQLSPDTAPFLFADLSFTEEPQQVVKLVNAVTKYQHNAKTACKDEERCFAICEAKCLGYSDRDISKFYRVSRHTVQAIVSEMERQGKLAPLKQRLSKKMGQVIEAGVDAIHQKINDGTMPANVLPVVVGVLSDKKAMIDGDPTQRVEVASGPKQPTVEDFNAKLAKLPSAKPGADIVIIDVPTDSQSSGKDEKPQ